MDRTGELSVSGGDDSDERLDLSSAHDTDEDDRHSITDDDSVVGGDDGDDDDDDEVVEDKDDEGERERAHRKGRGDDANGSQIFDDKVEAEIVAAFKAYKGGRLPIKVQRALRRSCWRADSADEADGIVVAS